MISSNVWKLAVAELAIFIVLLPIVIYILVRHGKRGIEGWGFLAVFCMLRLTSSGIQAGHKNSYSSTGSIINSIGISGLLLAFSGVLHEVARSDAAHNARSGSVLALLFHVMVVTGIILAAIGGSNLAKTQEPGHDFTKDHNLQKGGYAILLLAVVLLVAYSITLLVRLSSQRSRSKSSAMRLLSCTMAALVFGIVRVAYGLASAVSGSPKLSPVTGTFAVKFVPLFLVQLIATLLLIVGGFRSMDLQHENRNRDTPDGALELGHIK